MSGGRRIREVSPPGLGAEPPRVPSESQRAAIEATAAPTLVLAGPGAGKTFCLIERIRFLLEQLGVEPERICAFTFTNKAAGEIADRLERTLGERASLVQTGTIHRFCAALLREFGTRIGVERGFGIADEDAQRVILRRLRQRPEWHGSILGRFTAHRFRAEPFRYPSDAELFRRYEQFLAERRLLDFDQLVIRTAELLADAGVVQRVRSRWDCILVDEFQDLNPFQYRVVRELGREHRHIFVVGDDEQSIYSWAGADPKVFVEFLNDFGMNNKIALRENRRCPREILAAARRLVEKNPPMFDEPKILEADRDAGDCITVLSFRTDDDEIAWIIGDLREQYGAHDLPWGEFALLYRTHRIGEAAEAALLAAGLPCRLAHGRALGEDPIVRYLVAALFVIAFRSDVYEDAFLEVVLPKPLLDDARAIPETAERPLRERLERLARRLGRDHGYTRKVRRAFYTLDNLGAIGRQHATLPGLVEELLAHRVGEHRTILEEHHDELTDPCDHDEVVRLAERLDDAALDDRPVWLPRLGGAEIALEALLAGSGIRTVWLGGAPPDGAERLCPEDAPTLGLPLALFKAAQLIRCRRFADAFRDFTAVDLETTGLDVDRSEIVDLAAVRVRDGVIVDEFATLVRPGVAIETGAMRTHGIPAAEIAAAPSFADVWPAFRAFCGADVLVAHNGYAFDFPILSRMGGEPLCTYDTLPLARTLHLGSGKLVDLAERFGIDPGTAHRALDDARTAARVCLALNRLKLAYARKTALVNLLDQLGVALALWPHELCAEAERLRGWCAPYALGRYSDCLEHYRARREQCDDAGLPSVQQLIDRLGGDRLMQRLRAEKSATDRYPAAMARLRRLLDRLSAGTVTEQTVDFLERVALSRSDGAEPDGERINLLTLHSTKGLEFSRVYIVGVEDAELPGDTDRRSASAAEVEEARRLLYVGMTRTKDRLVMTRVEARNGCVTGGHRFLDEMGLTPRAPA